MMEMKTFADDDFDPKKWINRAWSSSANQEKEPFLANTVSRLQLYMKQLTNSLDETANQVITSIPRVLQDASTLQMEGSVLQQQLLKLEEKVTAVEEETGHSIQSLQKIDRLKACLENAASTLREADKWAVLAQSLEETLEKGIPTQQEALLQLSEQIAAMATSLDALTDSPEYESKRLQLEAIYNRVEAGITSPLLDALSNMNRETTLVYVRVFVAMRRVNRACALWRRCVATRHVAAWSDQPRWTTHHDDIHTQMQWLTEVLQVEKPLIEIYRLYTDLFLSLDPSPTKVTISKLKLCSSPQEGLDHICDLRVELDETLRTFTNLADNLNTVPPSVLRELGRAVYAPLRECLPRYTDLQTQLFNQFVENAKLEQGDLLEMSRTIHNLVERSDSLVKNAIVTAKKIGGDAALPYLMPAVESLISSISTTITQCLRKLTSDVRSGGASAGALSRAFPTARALSKAASLARDVVGRRLVGLVDEEKSVSESQGVLSIETLLLDDKSRQILNNIRNGGTVLPSLATLERATASLNALANDVLFEPAKIQLETIPSLNVWGNNDELSTDLPDFAISPQEYITEIGQYLMTLPQHLEMHLTEKQEPLLYLNEVCNQTCDVYAEKIRSINNMDALGTKRCLADIAYLSSVVEDLGSAITPALKNLENSIKIATPVN